MDIFVTAGTQLILIILNDKAYFFLIYSAVIYWPLYQTN